MASAYLHELPAPDGAEAGTRWFCVASWPFSAEPFGGPATRDWDDFTIVDEHSARFLWRSAADRIREAARQVSSGELAIEAALRNREFGEYIEQQVEFATAADEKTTIFDDAVAAIVERIVTGLADPSNESPIGYYCADDDLHLRHAAEAPQPLPTWARWRVVDAGGPGSGYEATVLVLRAGYGLDDLAQHLHSTGGH